MRIDILTLFPEMFSSPLSHSIPKRAQEKGVVEIALSNIRDYTTDSYRKVDDKPYGGGAGMVMMCDPVFRCVEDVEKEHAEKPRIILLCPQGKVFNQQMAREFAGEKRLMLITGRYEGFDERIHTGLDAERVSIGDYVLSGGELAAMVVIDAVIRLLPGAVGDAESVKDESFTENLLEYPHYTRPEEYRGMKVPDVLLSGNHAEIQKWRREMARKRTAKNRPDLLNND